MKTGLGVIIGRFQVHKLHEGHKSLIQYSLDRHDKTLIIIGCSKITDINNPLPYYFVTEMILSTFNSNNLIIDYQNDIIDDDIKWSKEIDKTIKKYSVEDKPVFLYGSRNSFKNHYFGKYEVNTIPEVKNLSGTDIREEVKNSWHCSEDIRRGVIWAIGNKSDEYVWTKGKDIVMVGTSALIVKDNKILLLKRKGSHGEGTWATPGGHIDFGESPEDCVVREMREEVGVLTNEKPIFLGITNDYFKNECKHYITLWYKINHTFGDAIINSKNEMSDIGWFDINKLPQPLFLCLNNAFKQNNNIKNLFKGDANGETSN